MSQLHIRPSATVIFLGMVIAVVAAYLMAYFIDEEELFLGFFLLVSLTYWFLLGDTPFRQRLVAISSPALYLLGYVYATQASTYSHAIGLLQPIMLPFHALFIAAIAVTSYTLVRIRPASPHLLHIILIPGGFLFWFYGSMGLLDDWL